MTHSILSKQFWGKDGVSRAMQGVQWHLNRCGILFNGFELDHDLGNSKSDVPQFIESFNNWYPTQTKPLRLSIAVGGTHFTAVDITLKPGKPPIIFCLDAADDSRGDDLAERLARGIPGAQVYYLEQPPVKLPDSSEEIFRHIQSTNTGCSRMVPWHLSVLARLNVAKLLAKAHIETTPTTETAGWLDPKTKDLVPPANLRRIRPEGLPAEFAPIFKITQKFENVETLPKHLREYPVSPDGQSLQEYCRNNKSGDNIDYPFSGVMARKQEALINNANQASFSSPLLTIFDFFALDKKGQKTYLQSQKQQRNLQLLLFSQARNLATCAHSIFPRISPAPIAITPKISTQRLA